MTLGLVRVLIGNVVDQLHQLFFNHQRLVEYLYRPGNDHYAVVDMCPTFVRNASRINVGVKLLKSMQKFSETAGRAKVLAKSLSFLAFFFCSKRHHHG